MTEQDLKRTPLFELHEKLGARFTPFGGWQMPVQYSGLSDEHNTVRNNVGIFDVSHMGELLVSGSGAKDFLEYITCNRVSDLEIGKAQYSMFLNSQGGVVDDIIIYKLEEQKFLICVNASNTQKDYDWVLEQSKGDVLVEDISANYAQIAIQGPLAQVLLEECAGVEKSSFSLDEFQAFSFRKIILSHVGGKPAVLAARTGYTGEDGFELFCSPEDAQTIAEKLIELGQSLGIKPAGLGARDTLRLEACYPLHGHEISDEITPLEAGLGWVVKLDKGDFIGREALIGQKQEGLSRKLVGLEVVVPGIVREGAKLFVADSEIGFVTSGTKPPTVNKAVALAIVNIDQSKLGTLLDAEVRTRKLQVKVIKKPFYKRS